MLDQANYCYVSFCTCMTMVVQWGSQWSQEHYMILVDELYVDILPINAFAATVKGEGSLQLLLRCPSFSRFDLGTVTEHFTCKNGPCNYCTESHTTWKPSLLKEWVCSSLAQMNSSHLLSKETYFSHNDTSRYVCIPVIFA